MLPRNDESTKLNRFFKNLLRLSQIYEIVTYLQCDRKSYIFECDDRDECDKLIQIRVGIDIFPNHACELVSRCFAIYCDEHWKENGVYCYDSSCVKYYCDNCSYANGDYCSTAQHCSNYLCNSHYRDEDVDVPFYCTKCTQK